ncbi:MAG: CBS domain-containing protein [candidate division Zixibacteria bacterium]|nr:CBS domain-containing protein [Phycisphaerae bacterium]NIR66612.1 CBS domain-containing protein [candidate division Zixibacteria bacterium]NIS48173.1 CBS domain-containing protein [candidate division Zixibacteria bacterium]NIU16289.1 CBS domain-containing protein [candidate division Zixibacteria bacterium]NIV08414.1 CBS domain-containing protein [candidate division Zixibacteria bacterium]
MIVMTSTFVVEILGPPFVKFGVKKAGEVGLNITEEDLIETYTVKDVMDRRVLGILTKQTLSEIIKVFSETDFFYYPVIEEGGKLMSVITIEGIRNTLASTEVNEWLIALDIMEPVAGKTRSDVPLAEAIEKIEQYDLDYLPVVEGDIDKFVGVLDSRSVRRALSTEVLARQKKSDEMHALTTS